MKETENLAIEQVRIEDLKVYKNNSKLHPPKQIRRLRDGIDRFGFVIPILIDKDNLIIGGHGRLEAAKELGMQTVPCIRRDKWDEDEVKAFRIFENKISETGFDEDRLNIEMKILPLEFQILIGYDPSIDPVLNEMQKTDNTNCEYPLVPKYSEKYNAVIIVIENEVDLAFIENALEIRTEKSYKTQAVGKSHVISLNRFKEIWEKRT